MSEIVVSGLTAGYDSAVIVRDVGFTIESGEALCVIGRNGMGKTTLLRALLGYLPNTTGKIELEGTSIRGDAPFRIARRGVAYAPQEDAIFADVSVKDNLEGAGKSLRQLHSRLKQIYEYFPILGSRLDQSAGTLSGGEQKMLVLAMALVRDPKILVIDEISDGLQPSMVSVVREVLLEERRTRGTTLLIVEQNIDLAFSVSDRIAVMKLGAFALECAAAPEHRPAVLAQLAP